MTPRSIGIGLALITLAASGAQAERSLYTPTRGPACIDRSREDFSQLQCPGPAGYRAEFLDEGNVVAISLWRPAKKRQAALSVSWRGAGKIFGDKLEWRIDAGEIKSAILRIWRVDAAPNGAERELEELLVLKVAPEGACRVASINAHQAGANEAAQRRSAEAASLPCL